MASITPYFFQYEVRPKRKNKKYQDIAGAIGTVIVFAETAEMAMARAARCIGRNNWESIEVKRGMAMSTLQIERLDGALKKLYTQAERMGIAAIFEGWEPGPKNTTHISG